MSYIKKKTIETDMHQKRVLWLTVTIGIVAFFASFIFYRPQTADCLRSFVDEQGKTVPSESALPPIEKKAKPVAFTFDDGPNAGTTDWLLEALAARDAKATFFTLGCHLAGNEAIIRQMAEDGHQIGCHTYDHKQLTVLSCAQQKREVDDWYTQISEILGDFTYMIRPPYGSVNNGVCDNLCAPFVLWTVDTEDWTGKDAQSIADYIVAEVQEGDIILLHDIFEESVKGAVMAMDQLAESGYTFVTVNELMQLYGIEAENGKVYRCLR